MKKWIPIFAACIILGTAIVFFLLDSADDVKKLNETEAAAKVTQWSGGSVNATALEGHDF